jgi:hypothetical protein
MRKLASIAAVLAGWAAMAPPAAAANICIATRNIIDTQPQDDGKAIFFRLYDGSTWRNDLKGSCPDLRFNGFAWSVRNPDGSVCENTQPLHVLNSGQICVLGKFTQVIPPRNKKM